MKFQVLICLVALLASAVDAFAPQKVQTRRTLIASRRPTAIRASADDDSAPPKKKKSVKKKTKKKKAVKKTATPVKDEPVETFRKPEFIASIAEKTGMSKADSEAALAAVLETITEVSGSTLKFVC